MEKQVQHIFYVDITHDGWKKGQKHLPIYKQIRDFSEKENQVQIYFSHLPKLLMEKKTFRKKNHWLEQLKAVINQVQEVAGIEEDEILFSRDLAELLGRKQTVPICLYGVCLKQSRLKKEVLSLSLPEDGGFMVKEQLQYLLQPYLPRVNQVVFAGEESFLSGRLEAYLYEEYGILASYEKKPRQGTIWIDRSEKENPVLARYAIENGIYQLNDTEVLKFLDTITKNGYNTEVD